MWGRWVRRASRTSGTNAGKKTGKGCVEAKVYGEAM